jgi:hypothetical protein
MDIKISVLEPAEEFGLCTLYEAKIALNLPQTDTSKDDQIDLFIKWSSDEIATSCMRTFAKEKVAETFRHLPTGDRLYLSHYPVCDLTSVAIGDSMLGSADYELDADQGRITSLNGDWSDPVTVIYTGGYELPYQAPPALAQSCLLLTKEAYYSAIRGDPTIRLISHKESRVAYFDPLAHMTGTGAAASGGSPARRAISDLIRSYTRYWI